MKAKYFKLSLGIIFLMFLVSFTQGCKDDDDNDSQPLPMETSIVDIAANNADFSILVEALIKADLVDVLNGSGPFTVFAPTDDAFQELFSELGISGIDDLSVESLTPILLYHVLGAQVKSTDLSTGYFETLSSFTPGDYAINILVDLESGVKLNATTSVTTADVMASNGVIHIIDKVLLPPDIVDIAIANDTFTHLVAAIVKADLVTALKADGPFTVFAPTDAAFEVLFETLGVMGIEDINKEILIPILLYHVVSGNVRAADVSTGMVPTLNQDYELDINIDGDGVMINGSINVIATDVQGKNGVVHVIDKVLVPGADSGPQSIADIASGDTNFSSLVLALAKADLVETLDSEGTFTVFAPTNTAFQNLFDALGVSGIADLSEEDLTQILLYHVLGSKKMSTDLSTGYLETLSTNSPDSDPVVIRVDVDGGVMLNKETAVVTADIEAFNGVIHIVDEVLLQPNVVNVAIANPNFDHLVAAVVKADLAETLSGDGPFTIFAPTDAAFETLFETLGVDGVDDLTAETLTPILLHHVVSGNVRSADVSIGEVTTLNGMFNIDISSGVVINGDTNVTGFDVQGTNGVIHVIDKVLIP